MGELIEFYCTPLKLGQEGEDDSIVSGLSSWKNEKNELLLPGLGNPGEQQVLLLVEMLGGCPARLSVLQTPLTSSGSLQLPTLLSLAPTPLLR